MAGLKVSSFTCILVVLLIVSSYVACPGEARRLITEVAATPASKEAVEHASAQSPPAAAGVTAASKMASTDGRPTSPGHSPGIGNKANGNVR
uniref:SMP domain-containing protein n=1 Tax=Oryza brachyantha TaxID=4533 RepID=J3MY85_ORYBR